MQVRDATDAALARRIADLLPAARWFGEKSAAITDVTLACRVDLGETDYQWVVAAVHTSAGAQPVLYQLVVGMVEGEVRDILTDPQRLAEVVPLLLGGALPELTITRYGTQPLPAELPVRVIGAEQSNTSVIVGGVAMLKFYRRLQPGLNPDVELTAALTRGGATAVAALRASVQWGEYSVAMVQDFIAGATEGWDAALASVERTCAAKTLPVEDRWSAHAEDLGAAIAGIHRVLAAECGTTTRPTADLRPAWQRRLEAAVHAAPQLAHHAAAVREIFAAVPPVMTAQRIHGDLHLGQVLLTDNGWVVLDFEGEPARPLAERQAPDSVWRDLAGIVRSLDYAACFSAHSRGETPSPMALAWRERMVAAVMRGYGVECDSTPEEAAILRAYLVDKALYEVVYEANNRPAWVGIPLQALGQLVDGA